ncbi:MAG: PKD domain-containing protein [Bacteroidetes bacterium]|nr:MAG: PKD domain-containing protein [Bacteroidota bacterium]
MKAKLPLLVLPAIILLWYGRLGAQCAGIGFYASETSVCAPKSIKFFSTNVPAGSTFEWNYGFGAVLGKDTGQYIYTNTGNYTVSLRVVLADGVTECIVSKPNYITVNKNPVPLFSVSRSVLCDGPDTVTVSDVSTGVQSRSWIVDGLPIADTTPQFVYSFTTAGVKSIVLAASSVNCPTVYYKVDSAVRIYNPMSFDFAADTTKGCVPLMITYSVKNLTAGHTPGQYNWSFSGGNPSAATQPNPTVQYNTAGTFAASLQIINTDGCSYGVNKPGYLVLGDSIGFTVNPSKNSGCRGEEFILNISNPMLGGDFTWDLGSGNAQAGSTQHSQRVVFSDTGYKAITVTRDYNGCITTKAVNNLVYITPPLANFLVLNPVECDSTARVYLFNRSRLATGATHTYLWKFYNPDGALEGTSTDSIPVFYTSRMGNYSLELVVKGSNGCSDSILQTTSISRRTGRSNFIVDPSVSCANNTVTFTSTSSAFSSGEPNIYEWTIFGKDGATVLKHQNSGAFPRISYNFSDTGDYKVALKVFNSKCEDTFNLLAPIKIIKPTTTITANNYLPCVDVPISLQANTVPDISPVNYKYTWCLQNAADTGITFTGSGATFPVTIDKPGRYHATLITQWAQGCIDTVRVNSLIKVSGVVLTAQFSNPTSCVPLVGNASAAVTQNYNFLNPGNATINYSWHTKPVTGVVFTTPNASATQVTFNQTGEYILLVAATNASGCSDTIAFTSSVFSGIRAGFSIPVSVCFGDSVATVNEAELVPDKYQWTVTPSTAAFLPSANVAAPKIQFADSGVYTVRQIVSKGGICYDTAVHQVRAVKVIAGFYTNDTLKYCAPVSVQYTNTSVNADTLIWWQEAAPRVEMPAVSQYTSVYFRNSGPQGFFVNLIARNKLGCADTLLRPAYLTILGPVAKFTLDDDKGCTPHTVTFTDSSKYYSEYFFDYGDGSVFDSTGNPGTHMYVRAANDTIAESRIYKPKVFLLDAQGCLAEYNYQGELRVSNYPITHPVITNTEGCVPLSVDFFDSAILGKTWKWDFENDGTTDANGRRAKHTYTTAGSYDVLLRVNSDWGCEKIDTLKNGVIVHDLPVAGFTLNKDDNDTARIFYDFVNQSLNYASLEWYDDTTYINNGNLFRYGFRDTGYRTVRLIAISAENCRDTIDSTIYVAPDYFFHIPTAFTPNQKDGNETFGVYGPLWAKRFSMKIYNRYGQQIFETNKVAEQWDGTHLGVPCQQDTYAYQIEYLDLYGKWHVFSGTVILLR